jgi:hypothetical protein
MYLEFSCKGPVGAYTTFWIDATGQLRVDKNLKVYLRNYDGKLTVFSRNSRGHTKLTFNNLLEHWQIETPINITDEFKHVMFLNKGEINTGYVNLAMLSSIRQGTSSIKFQSFTGIDDEILTVNILPRSKRNSHSFPQPVFINNTERGFIRNDGAILVYM